MRRQDQGEENLSSSNVSVELSFFNIYKGSRAFYDFHM